MANSLLDKANIHEFDSPMTLLKKAGKENLQPQEVEAIKQLADRIQADEEEFGMSLISRALEPAEEDLDTARAAFLTTEELSAAESRIPRLEKGATTVWTVRLPYKAHASAPEDFELEVIDEASGPRYCLGAQVQTSQTIEGPHGEASPFLRMMRIEVILPPTRGMAERFRPQTAEQESMKACVPIMPNVSARDLGNEQEREIKAHFKRFLHAYDLTVMDAEPIARNDSGFRSWVVSVMDKEWSQKIAPEIKDAIYTKLLKSNAGYRGDTAKPDYREYDYVQFSPEQAGILARALGDGPYVEDDDVIVDGRSQLLLGHVPENDQELLETQFRAWTGHITEQKVAVSKGVFRPKTPGAVESAYEQAQDWHAQAVDKLGEDAGKTKDVLIVLNMLERVVETGEHLLVLVSGDQTKIGNGLLGKALVSATYLSGSLHKSPSGSRAQFGRISGNGQLIQFLSMEGRRKMKELYDWTIDTIAERQRSLPGIYRTASLVNVKQAEEIAKGKAAYQTGRDGLTDALTGGGVRLPNKSWRYAMLSGEKAGENVDSSDTSEDDSSQLSVQMLKSVQRRYGVSVASHIKRLVLNGCCIYGYGYLHGAGTNSSQEILQSWHVPEDHLGRLKEGEDTGRADADPSSICIPKCATGKVNADDDGDIVVGLAAGYEGKKVVMIWRYPCVDLPVFIAFPKGTETPFDGHGEEERERFERIIDVYGPIMTEESAPLHDDEVTELTATRAWRMQSVGAKAGIKKTKRKGDNTIAEGLALAEAIGRLNMTGVLTRSLERIGELICLTQEVIDNGLPSAKPAAEHLMKQLKGGYVEEKGEIVFREGAAQRTLQRIEEQLTAFKYDTRTSIQPEDLTKLDAHKVLDEHFGPTSSEKVPNVSDASFEDPTEAIPLDYHKQPGQYQRVLASMRRDSSNEAVLEEYSPLNEGGLSAKMIASLDFTPVVNELKAINNSRTPFLKVIRRRITTAMKNVTEEEKPALKSEGEFIAGMCNEYRRFWTEIIQEGEAMIADAKSPDLMRSRVEEWHSRASRQVNMMMRAMSRKVSPLGLALGIYEDWSRKIEGGELEGQWRSSEAAGMALLTGRMGQVLLPAHMKTQMQIEEGRHTAVYRRGEPLPIKAAGYPAKVSVRHGNDNRLHVRLEEGPRKGEIFTVFVDENYPMPPMEDLIFRLARTTTKAGILSWRMQ